jgi:undecaprenyl-diphosphatase
LLQADAALRLWLTTHHTAWADWVMASLSLAGQAGLIWIVIAVVLAIRRRALTPRIVQVVLAVLLCQLVVDGVLKPSFARARPFDAIENVRIVGLRPVTYSFPSGHAASSLAGAFVLTSMVERRRRWLLWALAVLVALSRVYNGVHYPLDITVGALIGVGAGVLVTGGRAWYSQGSSVANPPGPR